MTAVPQKKKPNSVAKKKFGKTYPIVNSPEATLKDFWLLPLSKVTNRDGSVVFKHEAVLEAGHKLVVEASAQLKIGHTKLFDVLMESLWTHSYYDKSELLTVDIVSEAIGVAYEKLDADFRRSITCEKYDAERLSAVKALLNDAQLERFESKKPTAAKIRQKLKDFVDAMLEVSAARSKKSRVRNTIVLGVRGTLNRVGRNDHRKTQRELLFAELKTLQNTFVCVENAEGSWFRYGLIKSVAYDQAYDRIAVTFTEEYLKHFGSSEYSLKFLSSQARDKLTSTISLGMMRYLQVAGASRQRDGTFGVKTSVSRDELIKVLSLEGSVRPDNAITRAFRDIKKAVGIKYDYNRGTQLYTLNKSAYKVVDLLPEGFVDQDEYITDDQNN